MKGDELPEYLLDFSLILSTLCNELFDLKSAMLNLYDIINVNKYVVPEDMYNFFILMEVYGGDYELD